MSADDEDDIVWIREDEKEPTLSPTTPVTIVEATPTFTDAFEQPKTPNTPVVIVSEPDTHNHNNSHNHNNASKTFENAENSLAAAGKHEGSPASCDNSISFDISEYERDLNKTTIEANKLLDELEKKSGIVAQNNREIAQDIQDARRVLSQNGPTDVQKTINDVSQLPPPPELPSGGLASNVESVIIGEGHLQEITGTLVLPNGLVLITDEKSGILLFDIAGNLISKFNFPEFRKFWSPVYHKEHILILVDAQNAKNHWVRHVIKLTLDLKYVAKIECPAWLAECTILRERLSIAHNDHLYLCVCGETFSGLYELTPIGQWTELEYKLSEAYIDMLAFATIGPITQLLVVEGRRNYVLLVSVRESRIVDKKRIAICERPGALARDEAGRLFVANRFTAAIQLVDTIRWVSQKNIAITDGLVRHFTACWGLLAIPLKTSVRLQKYSFRTLG